MAKAATYKIYTGSAWEELTFTPSSHTHSEYLTASSSLSEANLTWGGKNFEASYGCIDAAMIPALGANRLAFMPAAGVTVEYSTNGGSTWFTYSIGNEGKINLFNGNGTSLYIGSSTATKIDKSKYMVRVTIETSTAQVYTVLNKFAILVSTGGSSGCYCTIDARTQTNYAAGTNTWVTFANKVPVSGWSGWNIINTTGITTYGNTVSQYRQVRFTFGVTSHASSVTYAGLCVMRILGFGGVGWTTPSTMAATGNIFVYDYAQNVTFPAAVKATSFYENGTALSSKYSTLANTIKALSISGQTITYTKGDGTTGTLTTQDTNTTYTFTNKAATLAWGTTSTIATVGGTDITVTMPANPNTDTTTYITKLDTRSLNPAPYSSSDYTGKVTWHLKTNSAIGISNESTYSGLLQLSPWNDSSGGSNHQLAFGTNGGIYHRYGTSSYGSWSKLAKTSDIPTVLNGNDVGTVADLSAYGATDVISAPALMNALDYYAANDHDHDNTYLKLSGGTITGDLTLESQINLPDNGWIGQGGMHMEDNTNNYYLNVTLEDGFEIYQDGNSIAFTPSVINFYNTEYGQYYIEFHNNELSFNYNGETVFRNSEDRTFATYVTPGYLTINAGANNVYISPEEMMFEFYSSTGGFTFTPHYIAHTVNGTRYEYLYPSKSGTLATLEDIQNSGGGGSSGTVTDDYSGILRETQIYDGSLSAGAYTDGTLCQGEQIPLNEGDIVKLYIYASSTYPRQQVGVIEVQMVDDGNGGLIGRGNMFTVRSNYSYQSLLVEAIVNCYSGYTDICFNIHALTASASAARSTLAVYKIEVISNS